MNVEYLCNEWSCQMKINTCISLPHPLHEYLLHEILVD